MSTYKGRTRDEHEAWVRENAEYFSVFLFRGKQRAETRTLEEAIALADKALSGQDATVNPAMIYAIKEIHAVMVGTYHPVTGFKPIKV